MVITQKFFEQLLEFGIDNVQISLIIHYLWSPGKCVLWERAAFHAKRWRIWDLCRRQKKIWFLKNILYIETMSVRTRGCHKRQKWGKIWQTNYFVQKDVQEAGWERGKNFFRLFLNWKWSGRKCVSWVFLVWKITHPSMESTCYLSKWL